MSTAAVFDALGDATRREIVRLLAQEPHSVGELAAAERIVLHELTPTVGSLEDAYMQLTADDVEYHAGGFPTPQEDAR